MDAVVVAGRNPRGIERVLLRFRVPDHIARLLAATPSLRWSWLAAGAAAVGFSAWAAQAGPQGIIVFLIVAPLLPVGGVAAAYGPWMDPMHELAEAAPTSNFVLVLIRSAAVLASAAFIGGAAAAALPGADWTAVAWILPALALTVACLALSTFVPVHRAAVVVAILWFTTIIVTELRSDRQFTTFRGPGQVGFFLVVVAAAVMLAIRRERLEVEGRARQRRLIDAGEAERRRIERNIHDGAQQQLVAIGVKAGVAKVLVDRDPARAAAILGEIQTEAQEALEGLRDMTRGGFPPVLADEGLAAALESKTRKTADHVSIRADGVGRFPKEIETAVYYCCLEAIQNATKYAHAELVTVELRFVAGSLAFTISDDGEGFDPRTTKRGVGVRSMQERVEALGGTLEIRSSPGAGATVSGRVPV